MDLIRAKYGAKTDVNSSAIAYYDIKQKRETPKPCVKQVYAEFKFASGNGFDRFAPFTLKITPTSHFKSGCSSQLCLGFTFKLTECSSFIYNTAE